MPGVPRAPLTQIRVKEDGAPGHGYNNLQGGKPTALHNKLVADLKKFQIELIKQPCHSPEVNACDIGFWNILRAYICEHSEAIPAFTGKNADQVEAAIGLW